MDSILKGWASVTEASHPNLFFAFETISHDCGAGAGHVSYFVPPEWVGQLSETEAALATLTGDRESSLEGEFSDFCIGEQDDMEALSARSPELTRVHSLLSAFFDDLNR